MHRDFNPSTFADILGPNVSVRFTRNTANGTATVELTLQTPHLAFQLRRAVTMTDMALKPTPPMEYVLREAVRELEAEVLARAFGRERPNVRVPTAADFGWDLGARYHR